MIQLAMVSRAHSAWIAFWHAQAVPVGSAILGGWRNWSPRRGATFRGAFRDAFRIDSPAILMHDAMTSKELPDGRGASVFD